MSISSLPPQPSLSLTQPPYQAGPAKHSSATTPETPSRDAHDKSPNTENTQAASIAPRSPDALSKMQKIAQLLSRESLINMMRAPYAKETAQNLKDLRALLSPDSLNLLSDDPKERAQIRAKVGELLSEKNIHGLRREATALPIAALTPEKIRERTAKIDPQESFDACRQVGKELKAEKLNIRHRERHCEPLCKNLIAIGQPLTLDTPGTPPVVKTETPAIPPSPNVAPRSKSTPQTITHDHAQASAEALATMREIGEILNRDSLIRMMREPNTTETVEHVKALERLLSDESLNSLSADPSEVAQLRTVINQIMSEANLQSLLREATFAVVT